MVVSDRQPLSPFGSAGIKHMATAFGGHTSSKTVGARALDGAGLKRSFHDGLCGGRALKGGGILSRPSGAVK